MTHLVENPVRGYETDELKRSFREQYRAVHVHETTDGLLRRATIKLMELELRSRGVDPAEVVGREVPA